jgi:cation diffusion facilitator family transporter
MLSNALLAIAKLIAGALGASSALVADGIHSATDFVYHLVLMPFARHASIPADREHPYGHLQIETIGSGVVGAFVLTASVAILFHEVETFGLLVRGNAELWRTTPVALWVAACSAGAKALLTFWTRHLSAKTENAVLHAVAADHRTDIFISTGVAVGILVVRLGASWIDPFIGAGVAVAVGITGIRILRNATYDLMDAVPPTTLDREIREAAETVEAVRRVERVHAHRFGPYFVVNLTIGLDGKMTIAEGDRVCHQVVRAVQGSMPWVRTVYVHHHPA